MFAIHGRSYESVFPKPLIEYVTFSQLAETISKDKICTENGKWMPAIACYYTKVNTGISNGFL